ncbi:hypothetical protein Btru_061261 [Bulinus truncatus]|nr:hypothetical protein Btru_061261 [Bulinus truncatus]
MCLRYSSVAIATTDVEVAIATTDVEVAIATTDVEVAIATTDVEVAIATIDVEVAIATTDVEVAIATTDVEVAIATIDVEVAIATIDVEVAIATIDVEVQCRDSILGEFVNLNLFLPISHYGDLNVVVLSSDCSTDTTLNILNDVAYYVTPWGKKGGGVDTMIKNDFKKTALLFSVVSRLKLTRCINKQIKSSLIIYFLVIQQSHVLT